MGRNGSLPQGRHAFSSPATGALRLPWTASRPAPYMTAREDGDEALARRAAAGDGAAFAALYDRYERKAYNLCYRITGSAQDDALDDDAGWLAEHLNGCGTCRVRVEAMEEAGVAYRLWLPLVPALWLRGEAIAHAAERVGADWSAVAATRRSRGRRLRLAAAGGAVLVIALLLALVDR